jgi:hypothetical protein
VADSSQDRVLVYLAPLETGGPAGTGDDTADFVFGQGGSFTTFNCNQSGPASAGTLCDPLGVAVDGDGNVYVADSDNARVLVYLDPLETGGAGTGDATADFVFGQGGNFMTSECNQGGTASANTLCSPEGVAVDSDGNVYVADDDNNRVLVYLDPLNTDATADFVFGQGGSFTSDTCNLGDISAGTLCGPEGVTVDGVGNLYAMDSGNHRVLVYSSFSGVAGGQFWQCFNVTGGDDPRESLTLTTEFGDDDVTVRRATRFCETATKNGEGSLEPLAFYLCYTVTGGMDPNEDVTLTTANFGEDDVTVRSATSMCAPAEKYVEGSYVGDLDLPSQQCFNLTGGIDPREGVTLATDNFGEDDVTVRRSNLMCEEALVDADNGALPEPVQRQCFTLTGGNDPNREIEVRTELVGEDTVRVRASTLMCEASLNQPPVAVDDVRDLDSGGCAFFVFSGVLANDTDPDGGPQDLTAVLVSGPTDVSFFELNSDGSFSITYEVGGGPTRTFTYQAFDGEDLSNTATVTTNNPGCT